jgi:hypothetical protein
MAKGAEDSTFTFADLVRDGYLERDAHGDHTVGARGFVRHWNSARLVPHLYDAATGRLHHLRRRGVDPRQGPPTSSAWGCAARCSGSSTPTATACWAACSLASCGD